MSWLWQTVLRWTVECTCLFWAWWKKEKYNLPRVFCKTKNYSNKISTQGALIILSLFNMKYFMKYNQILCRDPYFYFSLKEWEILKFILLMSRTKLHILWSLFLFLWIYIYVHMWKFLLWSVYSYHVSKFWTWFCCCGLMIYYKFPSMSHLYQPIMMTIKHSITWYITIFKQFSN